MAPNGRLKSDGNEVRWETRPDEDKTGQTEIGSDETSVFKSNAQTENFHWLSHLRMSQSHMM
jgi:hypothetical protein